MKATEASDFSDKVIAVIGCGNMGGALVRGFCQRIVEAPGQVRCYDPDQEKLGQLATELGVKAEASVSQAVSGAQAIVLAVKPGMVSSVVKEISSVTAGVSGNTMLISVAAGVRISAIREALGQDLPIVRVMPNIACLVGQGMCGIFSDNKDCAAAVERLFLSVGKAEIVAKEDDLDIVTGLSGSGPGFLFPIIEALADGAVRMGLPRAQALRLAAQTMVGAGVLARDTGKHPGELKDMVCSPAGTTIEGVGVLERSAVRGAFIAAVEAATEKARRH